MHRPERSPPTSSAWRDGFPIQARPVSKLEHAFRWCWRRPAVAALLAVLTLTVALSLVGLLTLWRHSEAQRVGAESALALAVASDKAMSRTVREIVGLLATTVYAPQSLASERVASASRVVRDLTAKLRQDPGVAASNLVVVCELELLLSDDLVRRGKFDDSSALMVDSLKLLNARMRYIDDPDIEHAYAMAQMQLGWIAWRQGRQDDALVCYQNAEATLKGLANHPSKLDVILSLDESRRMIISLLGRKSLEEPRRSIMELHVRMLEALSEQPGGERAVGLLAKMARSDLALDASGSAKRLIAPHHFSAYRPRSEWFEWRVADWIAEDTQPYSTATDLTAESKGGGDVDAHAHGVIKVIESRCKSLGVYPALFPAAAWHVGAFATDRASDERRAGRLEDAQRTVARLFAFARLMQDRDSNEALYHLLLSIAFEQQSKNAWKIQDYPAIEGALRKALGEASIGLRLDPGNAEARLLVSGLQDKLIGLASQRP